MTSFLEVVRLGVKAVNDKERLQSESMLLEMRTKHPNDFFNECGKNFSDPDLDDPTRKTISIILNKSLKETENGKPLWYLLSSELKDKLKNASLSLLVSDKKFIARAASQAISIMFSWEYRDGNWTEILEKMIDECDNKKIEFRTSAITTLGFICEELSTSPMRMDRDLSDRVLAGICRGMQKSNNDEIKNIALHALRNALSFIHVVLEKLEYRDYLMDLLINIIKEVSLQTIENAMLSFQCILEISKWFYADFGNYMSSIADVSQKALASNESDIVVIVTELWNEFTSLELEHLRKMKKEGKNVDISKSFIKKNQNQIVPKIMLNLFHFDLKEEDDNDTSKSVYTSSMQTLKNMNELLGDSLEQTNMEFMEKFIKSSKPVERIAALAIYGCYAIGSSSMKVTKIFNGSSSNLMRLITDDEELEVKIAVLKLFITVASNHPGLIHQNSFLSKHLVTITKCCHGPVRVAKTVYLFFEKLVESSSKRDLNNSLFSENIRDILSEVVKSIVTRTTFKDASFIDDGFRCVLVLIEKVLKHSDILHFLPQFLEGVVKSVKASTDVKAQLLEGFMISVQMSLWKIHKEEHVIEKDKLIGMFDSIKNIIVNNGSNNEAVLTVATIGLNLRHDFELIASDSFDIFNHAVDELKNFEIVKTVLESCSMLCRDMRPFDMERMEKKFFKLLIQAFKEKNFPNEYRGMLFTTLGDFTLSYFDIFLRNAKILHDIFRNAFEAVVHFIQQDDAQFVEYGESLKSCIVDAYICILHSYNENSQKLSSSEIKEIKYFIRDMVKFIDITTDKKYNPTLEYALNCLTLLCDVVMVDNGEFKELLHIKVTTYLVEILSRFRNDNSEVDNIICFYERLKNKTR